MCGAAFTMISRNEILSFLRVKEHSAVLHAETHSAYIYLFIKSKPLQFDK